MKCAFSECLFKTSVYVTFFSHKSRKHRSYTLNNFKPDVIGQHQTLPHETHHVDDSDCEDTCTNPLMNISNGIQQRIGLLLLKLENVHNVSAKCINDLVEELHFIHTASAPVIYQLTETSLKKNNCALEEDIVTKLSEELCESHPTKTALGLDGLFGSVYKRRKYFKVFCNLLTYFLFVLARQVAMDSAMLRVIFGRRIEKLTLLSGIPDNIEELHLAVNQKFDIQDDFSLHYLDPDFEDFFTLNSTAQIKKKSTIKVATLEPIVLTLHPVQQNESFSESVTSEESFNAASTSSTAQESPDSSDSCASTIILSPSRSQQRKPWPAEFVLPQFSIETDVVL